MTNRTCALCGWRDAAMMVDLDHRSYPACSSCMAPTPDFPVTTQDDSSMAEKVRVAVRGMGGEGFTVADVRTRLGIDDYTGINTVSVAIRRMVKRGTLTVVRRYGNSTVYRKSEAV